MDNKTKGAWLLAQSKSLDGYSGAGAARLENISYSGKVGRLYNLLRRQSDEANTFTISKQIVDNACQLNGIDKSARRDGHGILFNSHTFRDGKYAEKAHRVLEQLKADERTRLTEVQDKLSRRGAMYEAEVEKVLGAELYKRLVSVGLFDRMEVSNSTESVGYIASPNDFQKYGRPFEEDPIDDAKALIASLTYGQTRSNSVRGRITMPEALIRSLVRGDELAAGAGGIRAIGEDYRELEARQVVETTEQSRGRFTMRLLKKDVGELALTIVRGGAAAQDAVLMDGSPARAFKGPHASRNEVRVKNDIADKRFVHDTLDRLRSGG